MPEDIKRTIQRFYDEVLNQGRFEVMDEILASGFVDHTPSRGTRANRDGVAQQIEAWRRAFPDLHVTVEEIIAEGSRLAVRTSWQGTQQGEYLGAAASGRRVEASAVDILHVEGDRITEAWHYGT